MNILFILVLESSTTSAKAMLLNAEDQLYDIETKAYPLYFNDATLHDAESVFMETAALGRALCAGKKINAIAIGATWHNIMLCDSKYRPATPVYNWTNTEAADICRALRADESYVNNYYHRTGCMVNAIYPAFKLKLLKERGYRLSDYQIADQGTYNYYRLTGERVVTGCMLSGEGFLNIREKSLDRVIMEELGIDETNFAKVAEYRYSAPLSETGARLLGIDKGVPVIAACPDGALNQIGAGALGRGIMTISVGTSGAARVATPEPVLPDIPGTWCYLAPGAWISGAAISGCCNCVDWYKEKVFGLDKSYGDIENALGGALDTPVFLPFLYGERCPGWHDERQAGFFGVKPRHTRYDFYRSVLEGVLFNLYQCYNVLSKLNGVPRKIKLSGGIVNSPFWSQMCADIFNMEMEVDSAQHGSLMGAAALGMEKLDILDRLTDFSVSARATIRPDTGGSDKYKSQYERYLYYYEKMKPE
jgi:gluconokinase